MTVNVYRYTEGAETLLGSAPWFAEAVEKFAPHLMQNEIDKARAIFTNDRRVWLGNKRLGEPLLLFMKGKE